jgi:hypothetical protein
MKKLLLVLMVVAMASFLFVGCLGTGIIDDDGDDGDDDGLVEVAITFDKEYTNAGGVTFVPCGDTVTVAFPTAVETDYVVYIAQRVETVGVMSYVNKVAATPNADRTVWTAKAYTIIPLEGECEPICLVALVKHPCCPPVEEILRVVTVDCTAPVLDLFVKFTDCADVCVIPDPCVPTVPGAYMEWTSRTTGLCDTVDCCKDACSGVNGWSLVIDPDVCLGPCDTETGTGCPVEGAFECGCLSYNDGKDPAVLTGIHYVDFSFEDNVGNAETSVWRLTFDTDSLVEFMMGSYDTITGLFVEALPALTPDAYGWYQVYDLEGCPLPTFK